MLGREKWPWESGLDSRNNTTANTSLCVCEMGARRDWGFDLATYFDTLITSYTRWSLRYIDNRG
jgi:hypothetical protein